MGRRKIKEAPVFRSWEDVDNALKEIAESELRLEEIVGELNKQIHGIKLSSAQEAKPLNDRIDALGKDIKAFVTEHRDELDGKTKMLNFGKTGFRLSTRLIIPKDGEASIIRRLKLRKMNDCVAITEKIDRDALKKYPEDEIIKVGGTLKKEDAFWFEADKTKLQAVI